MAWLVKASLLETANLFFLRVGHTHEDIDKLFSILVALILRCHHFQTPRELLNFLVQELRLASQMLGDVLVLIIDAMDKAKFC